MIYYLNGILNSIEKDFAVIEVSGVGYKVNIPTTAKERMPKIGSEILLFIYHAVREDAEELYGFLTKDERNLFALLITVSGVGPKASLSLMSSFAIETLTGAIVKGNAELLSTAPGVGKKTAQKISIELKEKLAKTLGVKLQEGMQLIQEESGLANDAIAALMTLGYTPKEAREAVLNSKIDLKNAKNVEEIIKASLKGLS